MELSNSDIVAVHESLWSVHVLHLFGDLDLSNADGLRREIEETASATRVLIDLSNCNYIDGTAMRTLARAVQLRGDALRIVAPAGSPAERAVRMAQLNGVLPLFQSFASALQW